MGTRTESQIKAQAAYTKRKRESGAKRYPYTWIPEDVEEELARIMKALDCSKSHAICVAVRHHKGKKTVKNIKW